MSRSFVRFGFLSFVLAALSSVPVTAHPVELVSRQDPPGPPRRVGISFSPAVSADGRYVAFESTSPNLAAGQSDPNGTYDVFLRDRQTGTVTLVSHAYGSAARAGSALSRSPQISADGRYVAFASQAVNLIAGQTEPAGSPTGDLFLWDRQTGATVLVSHAAASFTQAANAGVAQFDLSADGRYVAFSTTASDVTSGQGASTGTNVFLYDRLNGANVLVSHAAGSAAAPATASSQGPAISADGRFVAFRSDATSLVAGAVHPVPGDQTFVFDRSTGVNALVSHAAGAAGTAANGSSWGAWISDDGSWIAFASSAGNLVPGQVDNPATMDVFLFERATGAIQLVSRAAGTTATATHQSEVEVSVSADGAFVAHASFAANLVTGQVDPGSTNDLFLFDRAAGTNRLISRSFGSAVEAANETSSAPVLTADGSRVAFLSYATNLLPGLISSGLERDLYLWERSSGAVTLVSHFPGQPLTRDSAASDAVASGDGGFFAFASLGHLDGPGDSNGGADVFLYERATNVNQAVSYGPEASALAAGGLLFGAARLDATGRYAAFASTAPNLGQQNDNAFFDDVFLSDRATGEIRLVSRSAVSPTQAGDAQSRSPSLSADGRWTAFLSLATDLVAGQMDAPSTWDVFLFDREDGDVTLVSRTASSPLHAAGSCGNAPEISADGRYVAFTCEGTDLVPGQSDFNGGADVFLYDRDTGATTLISHALASAAQTGNNTSFFPVISADGRFIVYASRANDLIAGPVDPAARLQLFLYDRLAGGNTLVTHASGSPVTPSNGEAGRYALSADGSWIAFDSAATDLVPGAIDGNAAFDAFLFERSTGNVTLVSRSALSSTTTGNDTSLISHPRLSTDGRWVAYQSTATNLVPGQSDLAGTADAFLFDRLTGATVLVSRAAGSTATAAGGELPLLSADGTRVAYRSLSPGLVGGQNDANQARDFFLYHHPSGTTELVPHVPESPLTTAGDPDQGIFTPPALSDDGSVVLFVSAAPDLVPGDFNGEGDLFAHVSVVGPPVPLDLYTLTPCRLLDTRLAEDGPALSSGTAEVFILQGACGVPATARALAVNVTVVQGAGPGFLTFYPGDGTRATSATITFNPQEVRSNNAILGLAANGSGTLSVYPFVGGGGTVHLILDVVGYFE